MKKPDSDFLCLLAILLGALLSMASCQPRNEQYQCACSGYGINGTDTARFVVSVGPEEDGLEACYQAASSGTTSVTCFVEQ